MIQNLRLLNDLCEKVELRLHYNGVESSNLVMGHSNPVWVSGLGLRNNGGEGRTQ